jgi:hypothetical protein
LIPTPGSVEVLDNTGIPKDEVMSIKETEEDDIVGMVMLRVTKD